MIVLDASAAVEVLLQTPAGEPVGERILAPGPALALHAPHLLDVEVGQALRRLCAAGELAAKRASEALADLAGFPLHRHPHDLLLPRAWELRENLTVYDGVYIALAELLEAPLLTRDARLARGAGHLATVELF